jgi:hypothetical protein
MEKIVEELWVELQGKSKEEAMQLLMEFTEDIYAEGMSDGYSTAEDDDDEDDFVSDGDLDS